METIKQINIKNRTYYFYNDIINLDEYDESKIRVDKKDFNDMDIYYLGYEHRKKISECNVIKGVNPLYLRIMDMIVDISTYVSIQSVWGCINPRMKLY